MEGRVYVSTYPTMLGLINESLDGERRFGPGYFDLVVIDEAHRSVYQRYGAIFEYSTHSWLGSPQLRAMKPTATHTAYSIWKNGVPTDAYPLEDAVGDGYLVPPLIHLRPRKASQRRRDLRSILSDEEK